MVDLMLNTSSEKPIAFDGMFNALYVLKSAADPIGAIDISANLRKGEAAFFIDGLSWIDNFDTRIANTHGHEQIQRWFRAI